MKQRPIRSYINLNPGLISDGNTDAKKSVRPRRNAVMNRDRITEEYLLEKMKRYVVTTRTSNKSLARLAKRPTNDPIGNAARAEIRRRAANKPLPKRKAYAELQKHLEGKPNRIGKALPTLRGGNARNIAKAVQAATDKAARAKKEAAERKRIEQETLRDYKSRQRQRAKAKQDRDNRKAAAEAQRADEVKREANAIAKRKIARARAKSPAANTLVPLDTHPVEAPRNPGHEHAPIALNAHDAPKPAEVAKETPAPAALGTNANPIPLVTLPPEKPVKPGLFSRIKKAILPARAPRLPFKQTTSQPPQYAKPENRKQYAVAPNNFVVKDGRQYDAAKWYISKGGDIKPWSNLEKYSYHPNDEDTPHLEFHGDDPRMKNIQYNNWSERLPFHKNPGWIGRNILRRKAPPKWMIQMRDKEEGDRSKDFT